MSTGRPPLDVGSHGSITVREVGPGRWQAAARVRDLDGETRQVRRNGGSKAEATRRLKKDLRDRLTPASGEINGRTRISELAGTWLDEQERRGKLSAGTLRAYRSALRSAAEHLGGLRLSEVTPQTLHRGIEMLAQRAPTQARQALIVIKGSLGHAVRMGALPANPARELEPVPKRRSDPRALTPEEEDQLRRLARDHRRLINEATGRPWPGPRPTMTLPDVVDLLLGTGTRIGEALALRWQDIQLDEEPPTITVSGTLVGEGGVHRQDWTKTAAGYRTIAIPPSVVAVLERRRHEARARDTKVFSTKTGNWVTPNAVRRLWRSALEGSELEWVTPHTCRRTVATRIQRAAGYAAAMAQLGHASVAVTEQHYIARQRVHDHREALR